MSLDEIVLEGIAGAPGTAVGPVFLVDRRRAQVRRSHIAPDAVVGERARFRAAQTRALAELDDVRSRLEQIGSGEYLAILEAHRLMMNDPILIEGTERRVAAENINAEWALALTLKEIKVVFDRLTDDYFRERRSDIDVIGDRLQQALLGGDAAPVLAPAEGEVIVGHDLSPADALRMRDARVAGIALDVGGKTSHTVILARALGLPAVVGLGRLTELAGRGDTVVVDGDDGRVTLHPAEATMSAAVERARLQRERARRKGRPTAVAPRTKDGVAVSLQANIEFAPEAAAAARLGAMGIGLFRTEYLYMNRADLPSEDEQAAAYVQAVDAMRGQAVVLRTFDLGGDKFASAVRVGAEFGSARGLRAIRFALRFPAILKTQLVAMWRASAHGDIAILLPMISSIDEVRAAKQLAVEAREEVVSRGVAAAERVPIGIMVELPAAVLLMDELCREVDFVSVGTNDLIQYTLAVDRVQESEAGLYEPLHPAVVRSLDRITRAGAQARVPVSICGEMAAEPVHAALLLGLGFRAFSMNPIAVNAIRAAVRRLDTRRCEALAREVLAVARTEEVRRCVKAFNAQCGIDESD